MKCRCFLLLLSAITCGCGGATPVGPSPVPPVPATPDLGPVVINTPPVIGTFTVQGARTNEPSNFADASEEVPITVAVTDAESQITDLKFNWTSSAGGTFTGSGPKVVWKAPNKVDAPATVTLSVQVVETYVSQGKQLTNNPNGSVTLSLHDSVKEVGDMAVQFLKDFSDTSIKDVPYIMRNFGKDQTCYGTDEETGQVADHRQKFQITNWKVYPPVTTVGFGGICPYGALTFGDACAQVQVWWQNVLLKDLDADNKAGDLGYASGVDQVAAKYYPTQQRWWLCDSSFKGDDPPHATPSVRSFLLRPSS